MAQLSPLVHLSPVKHPVRSQRRAVDGPRRSVAPRLSAATLRLRAGYTFDTITNAPVDLRDSLVPRRSPPPRASGRCQKSRGTPCAIPTEPVNLPEPVRRSRRVKLIYACRDPDSRKKRIRIIAKWIGKLPKLQYLDLSHNPIESCPMSRASLDWPSLLNCEKSINPEHVANVEVWMGAD